MQEDFKEIDNLVKNLVDYLDSLGLELDENGDVIPKQKVMQLNLEIKNEK